MDPVQFGQLMALLQSIADYCRITAHMTAFAVTVGFAMVVIYFTFRPLWGLFERW